MFQGTLEAMRICRGYSIGEMAAYCEISEYQYAEYEKNPYEIPKNAAQMIKRILNISWDQVYLNYYASYSNSAIFTTLPKIVTRSAVGL